MRKIGDLGAKVGNTLKAIAKGSVAMIAAFEMTESLAEAFSRVYNEVMVDSCESNSARHHQFLKKILSQMKK